jgi:hypothetical protein
VNPSLPEVHSSVSTTQPSLWRRMFAFAGPAYLVSVGYMDPGNWATDLEGGARFGYELLWVLVLSNLMAILLQTFSARLGIVTQRDLAQACRETYPRSISYALWFLCEIAIAACDLAEVLGAAIALNLLFHIPLLTGVLLTAADTLLLLWFTRLGIRVIESFVLSLIAIIAGCFLVEISWAGWPALAPLAHGLVPHLSGRNLYLAIGILGATVMPHNLYLHSALVQTRRIGSSIAAKRMACRFNLIDSTGERRDYGSRGDGVLQARHRGDGDPASQPAPRAAAWNDVRERLVWNRLAVFRAIFDPDRHHGWADRDGGFPELPHTALAAAIDHPHGGDNSGGIHRLLGRRKGHLSVADSEPGDSQHAASVRGDSSDPVHQ